MRITKLSQTSPERFSVVFEDGTEVKTTLAVVTDMFLHSDLVLDGDQYERLLSASALSLCKARALRAVNARPMSRRELITRLTEKGETPENAEYCADWLCEMGLINDRLYAETVVRHYSSKGYGTNRVRQELNRHGVPRELWDDALLQMPGQDDHIMRFLSSRLSDPTDRAQVKKVSDALLRRGYTWDEIKHALHTYNSQEEY